MGCRCDPPMVFSILGQCSPMSSTPAHLIYFDPFPTACQNEAAGHLSWSLRAKIVESRSWKEKLELRKSEQGWAWQYMRFRSQQAEAGRPAWSSPGSETTLGAGSESLNTKISSTQHLIFKWGYGWAFISLSETSEEVV